MWFKYFQYLLITLMFSACSPKHYGITSYKTSFVAIKDTIPHEMEIVDFLNYYKTSLDSVMDQVIGITQIPLSKSQPESTLGNFAADAQLEAGKRLDNLVSISVVNYGGLRIPYVPKGSITRGRVYEIMPFDNMLTIIDIPGDVLRQFCNHMAKLKGWPIAGASYVIEAGKANDIKVNGLAIKDNQTYKLVTSDYIANGGDDCYFLVKLKQYPYSVFLRDALIEKIVNDSKKDSGIYPKIENRVVYAE
ncbi:MAG TPA: 5'-nucleotidase [Edaphocola sp.]|nr:5'-nucleotidase [Edaphocola sp.]